MKKDEEIKREYIYTRDEQYADILLIAIFSLILAWIYWSFTPVLPLHEHTSPPQEQLIPSNFFGIDCSPIYSFLNIVFFICFVASSLSILKMDLENCRKNPSIKGALGKIDYIFVISFGGLIIAKFFAELDWEIIAKPQAVVFIILSCILIGWLSIDKRKHQISWKDILRALWTAPHLAVKSK